MTDILWISLGAIVGANARYGVTLLAFSISPTFPFGTLIVNLTGSFLIGVILTLLTERLLVDPLWRLLLVVGFLGSYTTISSYAYETITLTEDGDWFRAIGYVLGTNGLCLVACYVGLQLVRMMK